MIQYGFSKEYCAQLILVMCVNSPDMMMIITVIEYNIIGSKSDNLYFSSIHCF